MTTVNKFIQEMKNLFSDIEYRATSKDGKVFKSSGWDKANERIQLRARKKFDKKL